MINRRNWLTAIGTATLAASTRTFQARAIDPIARQTKAPFKISLAAYSLRHLLTAKPPQQPRMNLFGFLDYCATLGFHGAEPTSYYFPEQFAPSYLDDLKRHAHLLGLDFSGGAIRNDFCTADPTRLKRDWDHCETWCRHYARLGVRVIRVFAGNTPRGETDAQAVRRCIAGLTRACEAAAKHGIMLALENHGGITRSADTMLEIVRGVQSPWFGVNLDSGNFRDSADPYAELAKIAPFALNVQIKTEIIRKVQGKEKKEPADFRKLAEIIKGANYAGWVALEYEADENPESAIPKALGQLRTEFNA